MKKKPPEVFGMRIAGKGEYVGARSFDQTFSDALDLLQELDRTVSGVEDGTIEWEIINASVKSPLFLGLAAKTKFAADYSDNVVNAVLDGIEVLEREPQVPNYYTPIALEALKRLTDHCGNGVATITFVSPTRTITPSHRVSENVTRIIEQPTAPPTVAQKSYSERGTVEGTIINLIGSENYFSLYDVLSNKRVPCDYRQELSEEVRAGWRKRVIVDGLLRYTADGKLDRVKVDSLKVKPDRSLLPQFKGTYISITGGAESSAYVRGLRDDD